MACQIIRGTFYRGKILERNKIFFHISDDYSTSNNHFTRHPGFPPGQRPPGSEMMNGMPNNSTPSAPKPEPKTEPEDGGALPNDILRLLNDNDNPVPSNVPPAKNDPVSCGVCQKDVSF